MAERAPAYAGSPVCCECDRGVFWNCPRHGLSREIERVPLGPEPDKLTLAVHLESRADQLETFARTNTPHPDFRGIDEIGAHVRALRREADRLRGQRG